MYRYIHHHFCSFGPVERAAMTTVESLLGDGLPSASGLSPTTAAASTPLNNNPRPMMVGGASALRLDGA